MTTARACILAWLTATLFLLSTTFTQTALAATATGETVCIQCHSSQTGRGGKPVTPWRQSIHAENGISCNHCHGGDPADMVNAMNPQRGFLGVPGQTGIPAFCGRCHIGIKDDYLRSAHGMALGKNGPTCVTCHGSHEIKKASLELINEQLCSGCHEFERARAIRDAMKQTEATLISLGKRIETFRGEGVDTAALEKRLFAQRNNYHRLFHEINPVRTRAESIRIAAELKPIAQTLDNLEAEQRGRKIIGVFAVSAALLAALLFHQLHKTYSS